VIPSFRYHVRYEHSSAGHTFAQLRVNFQPIARGYPFLVYAQHFDIIPQLHTLTEDTTRGHFPDPISRLYILKCAIRSDGTWIGGIVELSRVRVPVELVPRFGERADHRLTKTNSLECSTEFSLNRYSDKEIYKLVF
jgi:hypothetical protein